MKDYKKLLKLGAHVEGGYFSTFYRSQHKIVSMDKRKEERCAGSSIYFLLEKGDFSSWHRIQSDEIWHYYDGGSAVNIYHIDEAGKIKTQILGAPYRVCGATFQVVMKANVWFAAELCDPSSFALMGCTVSPGFEYKDFELGKRDELIQQYPELSEMIIKLTR